MKLKNFINDLSRKLQKQGIDVDLEPLACEEMSQVTQVEAQQDRINDMIKESQFCFVLVGDEIGKYTLLEYDVAMEWYKQYGEPRVVVNVKRSPDQKDFSKSVKEFINYRYEKQRHYTNTFEHVDSIKITIILELLNSNLLSETNLSIHNGIAILGKEPLTDIVNVNDIPMIQKNESLVFKRKQLNKLLEQRQELEKQAAAKPTNQSIKRNLLETKRQIDQTSDEIYEIETNIVGLLQTVLNTDRNENISDRQLQAIEALENGDYETAKDLLSGDQWIEEIKAADHAVDYAERVKKETEIAIEKNKETIQQEISTQRLRISVLRSMGITDDTAKDIGKIYEVITEYAIKYNSNLDMVLEYESFLAEQEDYKNAIRIGELLEKYKPDDMYTLSSCYFLLGKMHRQRNDFEQTRRYANLLDDLSNSGMDAINSLRKLVQAESLVLKEKCESVGSSKLIKYASEALSIIDGIKHEYDKQAFHVEREAKYWLAINYRELIRIKNGNEKRNYEKAKEAFESLLPELRLRVMQDPEEYTKELGIWLNSYGNLYKKAQDEGVDNNGYMLAEPLRIESYEILHEAYNNNHAKYARDYALACQTLGNLYRSMYRFSESEKYHLEAIELFRELSSVDEEANLLDCIEECNNITNLMRSIGDLERGKQYAEEGIRLLDNHIFPQELKSSFYEVKINLCNSISLILIEQNHRTDAIDYYERKLACSKEYSAWVKSEKRPEEQTAPEPIGFIKKYQVKQSENFDAASEDKLILAYEKYEKLEANNRIEATALYNRRILCQISEKLMMIRPEEYALKYAYWCCLLGMIKKAGTIDERLLLYRNSCFICNRFGKEVNTNNIGILREIYVHLTEFDQNILDESGLLPDIYVWNRYLLIDLYYKQLEYVSKTKENRTIQEFNIASEYSFIANAYIRQKKFDLALIAAEKYKEHMINGKDAPPQPNGDVFLGDAYIMVAKSFLYSPQTEIEYALKNLEKAELHIKKHATDDMQACNCLVNCYESFAHVYIKTGDNERFESYLAKVKTTISSCKVISLSTKRMMQQNADSLKKELLTLYPQRREKKKTTVEKMTNQNKKEEQRIENDNFSHHLDVNERTTKTIHYKKIQKLKKQGLTFDEVVKKLKLSPTTVKINWDSDEETPI